MPPLLFLLLACAHGAPGTVHTSKALQPLLRVSPPQSQRFQALDAKAGVGNIKVTCNPPDLQQDGDHGTCVKASLKIEGSTMEKAQPPVGDGGVVEAIKQGVANLGAKLGLGGTPKPPVFADGSTKSRTMSIQVDVGASFEPDPGPFISATLNFPNTFSQMFPAMIEKIQGAMVEAGLVTQAECDQGAMNNLKAMAAKLKDMSDQFKKDHPTLVALLNNFDVGINTGNKGNKGSEDGGNEGNDGILVDFKFQDTNNMVCPKPTGEACTKAEEVPGPSFKLEWRLQDSNELTSFCMNLIPGPAPPAPGTCGWSNQGLHAQVQLTGLSLLKAASTAILGKPANEFTGESAKNDIWAAAQNTWKDLKDKKKNTKGLAFSFLNAVKEGINEAVLVVTLELRLAVFTIGMHKDVKVGCRIENFLQSVDSSIPTSEKCAAT